MEQNPKFSHNIYKKDPLLFKSYVGKEVNILNEDETTTSGIVYTIDPVSESVVLLQGHQQNHLKIVFGHVIKNIEICSDKLCKLPELFENPPTCFLQSTLNERKNTVIKMLQENRFPVREEKDILIIEDVLSIRPPYKPNNCTSANSIVLGRIQNLLSSIEI
ncbi:gem-associated protein 6 [Nomia melanderi]|uniref:gem-associated protein 6 n=1 Tax=Nomia melanderi TaxID=2448451 RepID=UPI0013047522|nr:gem-associated protein 6-like [Nomia melanderi]